MGKVYTYLYVCGVHVFTCEVYIYACVGKVWVRVPMHSYVCGVLVSV